MKLYIKYMVSLRCKMIVADELNKMNLRFSAVDLGNVELLDDISMSQLDTLRTNLQHFGLELLDDKRNIMIEKIKSVVIEMIHYSDEVPKTNYSVYISEKLHYDYTYLSNIFSEVRALRFSNTSFLIK